AAAGFVRADVPTPLGPVATWRRGAAGARIVSVYLEGDGRAWVSRRRPSEDPTPVNPVALRLALADPGPDVVYVARPCQYLEQAVRACEQRYWTTARYAEAVVAAVDAALDVVLSGDAAPALALVGFSGGGAIAALLAARRDDVGWLVGVAPNLDTSAWTAHHAVTPLEGSLNPVAVAPRLGRLPQAHLFGAADEVMPARVARTWFDALPPGAPAASRVVDGMRHACCWERTWPRVPCEALAGVSDALPAFCGAVR
ncbi:MAG: hypothetical protein ACU85V_10245, partial [Gammaproteobacteria bacterium]